MANLLSELGDNPMLAARLWELADRTNARLIEAEQQLEWGFCHGDLHGGNARVLNDHLTLFDFDCCAHGWQIYDLATYRWAARLRGAEDIMIVRQLWLMGLHISNADEMGRSEAIA